MINKTFQAVHDNHNPYSGLRGSLPLLGRLSRLCGTVQTCTLGTSWLRHQKHITKFGFMAFAVFIHKFLFGARSDITVNVLSHIIIHYRYRALKIRSPLNNISFFGHYREFNLSHFVLSCAPCTHTHTQYKYIKPPTNQPLRRYKDTFPDKEIKLLS